VKARRGRWLWLVAPIVLAGGSAAAWAKRGAGHPEPVDAAALVTVKRGTLAVEVVEAGRVAAREKVEVKSKVSGQVTSVLVREGDAVKKGQLLMTLDPTDYDREVARADAEVKRLENDVERARAVLERTRRGVAATVIGQNEADDARFDLLAKEAAVKSAQVALASARDKVHYTKIYAPLAGTVTHRGIEPGEVVVPGVQSTFEGKPLLTVADLSTLVVNVDLHQIDAAKVALGQKAAVTLDALPGAAYTGKVTKVAPASVKRAGKEVEVFPVEVTLDVAEARVRPGMTADVRIRLDERPGVLAAPVEALVTEAGETYLTRVVGEGGPAQRKEKVAVKAGARNEREIEIVEGVAEGDRVLLAPPASSANEAKM
jgi:membrane fusion protein, macrolide-specific efflux system